MCIALVISPAFIKRKATDEAAEEERRRKKKDIEYMNFERKLFSVCLNFIRCAIAVSPAQCLMSLDWPIRFGGNGTVSYNRTVRQCEMRESHCSVVFFSGHQAGRIGYLGEFQHNHNRTPKQAQVQI